MGTTNLGQKVAIKVDINSNEYILVGIRSANRTAEVDEVDVTTRDSDDQANEYIPGFSNDTIDVEGVRVTSMTDRHEVEDIYDALKDRTTFTCIYGGTETGDTIYTYSDAFFTSLEETNEYNAEQTWSGTIRLSGKPSKSTVT